MTLSRLIKWGLTLALLGGIGWAVYWRIDSGEAPATKGPAAPPDPAVTVIQPRIQDVPLVVDLNGSVVPLRVVDVRSQISNLVREVLIKEGQVVRQGQPMFLLDDRNDRANVERLKASLARNRALAADQDRQLARARELVARNFIAQGAADTTQAQRDAQWAQVKSDEAALQAAEVALDYNTIRAPISGRTGVVNVFPGTLVQPAGAALVTVTQVDPIAVQFPVPESHLALLQSRLRAGGRSPVKVTIPSSQLVAQGQLYFMDSAVDAANGTIRAKATFANPEGNLWPGQFVQARVELGLLKEAVVVPANAVVTSTSGRFVYAVNPDLTVRQVPIKDVYAFKDQLVVEGPKPGDRIVLDGRQNVRPSGKVRVIVPGEGKGGGKGGDGKGAGKGPDSKGPEGKGPEGKGPEGKGPEGKGPEG
ncbi:MAG: efflux RND transporter periplasmic adaptor subunit, partial [Burkholderiales bacterium]